MLGSGDRGARLRPQDQAKPPRGIEGIQEPRLGSGSPLLDGTNMYRARDPEKSLPEVPALRMQIEEATTGNVPDGRMT